MRHQDARMLEESSRIQEMGTPISHEQHIEMPRLKCGWLDKNKKTYGEGRTMHKGMCLLNCFVEIQTTGFPTLGTLHHPYATQFGCHVLRSIGRTIYSSRLRCRSFGDAVMIQKGAPIYKGALRLSLITDNRSEGEALMKRTVTRLMQNKEGKSGMRIAI